MVIANNDLFNAQVNFTNAIFQVLSNKVDVERALGTLKIYLLTIRVMTYKLFVLLFIVLACSSCGHQDPPPPPPPVSVNVYTVKTGSAQYYNSYPATITAVNQVEIRPQVAGYITGIFFKEGQHVEKGQKLYQIDQQQYRGAYEQAVAQLNASEANLRKGTAGCGPL